MARLTPASGHPGRRATIVAVLGSPADLTGARLRGLNGVADALEVRADLVGEPDPGWLRRHFSGALVYSLPTGPHRGCVPGGQAQRHARLLGAAGHYDEIDLQWPADVVPPLLGAIDPHRRRISWHGPATDPAGPRERFRRMATTAAARYVLTQEASSAEAALAPLRLLAALRRPDVTAFATGPAGTWSRILAPWLGSPVVFGRAGPSGSDGMPGVHRLVSDYGLPALPPLSALFGIAGLSPGRSASPRLHNAAYRALGLPALYLPFQVDCLPRFWREMAENGLAAAGLPLQGVTVNAPHKEEALGLADLASPSALRCGAANLLSSQDGLWRAHTTDTCGVLMALTQAGVDVAGHRAAVVGCGGAGRAAAVGLQQAGAHVTLVNRGWERGTHAAELLGLPFVPLSRFSPEGHTMVVHATPLVEREPFPLTGVRADTVVLEMVYQHRPTPLMAAARARGLTTIDGWDVLLVEVPEQFRLLTGEPMPSELVRRYQVTLPATERVDQ